QKIVRIFDPFGDSFECKNLAKVIIAKKPGKVRVVDFSINGHGASARRARRGSSPTPGVSRLRAQGQTPGGSPMGNWALDECSSRRDTFAADFGDSRCPIGLDDAARDDKLDGIVWADRQFYDLARRQEKVKTCRGIRSTRQKYRNIIFAGELAGEGWAGRRANENDGPFSLAREFDHSHPSERRPGARKYGLENLLRAFVD